MDTISRQQDTVQARRNKAEIIRCSMCDMLVVQEPFCTSCGCVFSMEGLINTLIALGARKLDVAAA